MKDRKKIRRIIKFRKWWNRQWYTPGTFVTTRTVNLNGYLDEQTRGIWNAFTSIPIAKRGEIIYHIKQRLINVADTYYKKGKEDIYNKLIE